VTAGFGVVSISLEILAATPVCAYLGVFGRLRFLVGVGLRNHLVGVHLCGMLVAKVARSNHSSLLQVFSYLPLISRHPKSISIKQSDAQNRVHVRLAFRKTLLSSLALSVHKVPVARVLVPNLLPASPSQIHLQLSKHFRLLVVANDFGVGEKG
jgi:hypothetical protein